MSVTADINAAVDAAILNVDQFAEVLFTATYQKAADGYDPVLGQVSNSNPVIATKIIVPGSSLVETDGEALKLKALEGIMLRSWLPGQEVKPDDIINIPTGVYAGTYTVKGIAPDSIVHWEFALVR